MKKFSLNFKLGALVLFLIAGTSVVSYLGIIHLAHMNAVINELTEVRVVKAFIVKDLRALFYRQALDQRNVILEKTPEGLQNFTKRMKERHTLIVKKIADYEKGVSPTAQAEMEAFQEIYLKWWAVNEEVLEISHKGDEHAAFELAKNKAAPIRNAGDEKIENMSHRHEEEMIQVDKETDKEYTDTRSMMLMTTFAALFFGVGAASVVLTSLSRAISQIIADLSGSAEHVSQASQQIATSSVMLSEASTEQASSMEETVATLEELNSMVKVNSANARNAANLTEVTRDIAIRGESEIHELTICMSEISSDSKKIEEIISVIDSIAFQTNLLALNAAVEAARAGEQGKGFAVVAEAVRNLAQRSASAAKDINQLITSSVEKIERGSQQAGKSGRVLQEIVTSAKKASDLNAEIAEASGEQSNGLEQISKAMNQMDQVTQVNAATSEEAAAAAEELSAQAEQMNQIVGLLTETVKGSREPRPMNSIEAALRTETRVPASAKSASVIPFRKSAASTSTPKKETSDDWGMGKVGTTEGF